MNIFKNKYFLLGNLAFLLIVIPVVLFFVKNQTSTRGSAAPTTTLSFIDPTITTDQCDNTKTARLILNPGQNVVNKVNLALKWDKTKFDVVFTPNKTAFPEIKEAAASTPEGMTIKLAIGSVTNAISTTTDVGTVLIKPLAPTTKVDLEVDTINTKIYSLSGQDGASDNVFNPGGSQPLQVAVIAKSCADTNVTPSAPPEVSSAPTTAALSPTSAPTLAPTQGVANQSPICLDFTASTSSGAAPLSVTLTTAGHDSDGTISKATFNFGDGTQQDVTSGLGTASVSAQIAHTYNSGGNFSSTTVFTDNSGALSATCTQIIAVSGAIATKAPTATPTLADINPTEIPTATPTINNPGGVSVTFGLISGIILAIAAGIFLLAL